MKKLCSVLCLALFVTTAFAQGLVRFANNASTLVSVYGPTPGPIQPLPANAPGTYLFALMTAPAGVTDLSQFTFSGLYATNTAEAGRLQGSPPTGVAVDGWLPGQYRNFLVVGWPSFYPDFIGQGEPPSSYPSYCSPIGTGWAGGTIDTGASIPALSIFGAPPLVPGFVIYRVPEPAVLSLLTPAILAALLRRGSRSTAIG